jgi:hypothetical protein
MRQAGLSVMALAGLMIVGAPIAQAGVTCKVVPSWCPGGGDGSGNSNKALGGGNRLAWNGTTSHNSGNISGSGDAGNAGNRGNTGNGGNGGTNTTGGVAGNGGTNSGGNGATATGSAGNGGSNGGGTGNAGSQGNGGGGTGGAGSGGAGSASPTSVPEPASLLLLGAGVSAAGAAVFRRRKSKKD